MAIRRIIRSAGKLTLSCRSTPYKKLFNALRNGEISQSQLSRVIRKMMSYNPGIKPPTQGMRDALSKMNMTTAAKGQFLRGLGNMGRDSYTNAPSLDSVMKSLGV